MAVTCIFYVTWRFICMIRNVCITSWFAIPLGLHLFLIINLLHLSYKSSFLRMITHHPLSEFLSICFCGSVVSYFLLFRIIFIYFDSLPSQKVPFESFDSLVGEYTVWGHSKRTSPQKWLFFATPPPPPRHVTISHRF